MARENARLSQRGYALGEGICKRCCCYVGNPLTLSAHRFHPASKR